MVIKSNFWKDPNVYFFFNKGMIICASTNN